MKNIVIVGAGFGGLQLVLNLEKKFRADRNINLTLVDKRDYHLFTSNLYEAATTEEEIVSLEQVQKSISVPIAEVLKGKRVKFIKGEVNLVDTAKKEIIIDSKKLNFDYLVLALGSQSDFFNIEGAQEFALTLKSLPDALRIRNQLAFAIEAHKLDVNKKNINLVVAGGGYTGLELAGELKGLADFLAWENNYPREKIQIEVIEAANKLVAGFDDRLSQGALERFEDLNIHVRLSSRIAKVERGFIELATGDKISYDLMFWTTGVKAVSLKFNSDMHQDTKGRLPVNGYFQVDGHDDIFALGDMACVIGSNGRPVPGTAQDAVEQGKSLAVSLPYLINNQEPPQPYKNSQHGFIVSLGGKWAIMDYGGFYIKGYVAYLVHKMAHLRYYLSIVPFWKAIKWVLFETKMYERND